MAVSEEETGCETGAARTCSSLLGAPPSKRTARARSEHKKRMRAVRAQTRTLNRFATVSSGAGENARLMYVNWCTAAAAGGMRRETTGAVQERGRRWGATYQRVALLPPQLLAQELDDGLEAVRRGDLVEVLLHDGRVPHRFEAHDDWTRASSQGMGCDGPTEGTMKVDSRGGGGGESGE